MTSLPKTIILQKGYPSPVENSAVIVMSAQNDINLIRQTIDNISPISGALPIGSVEFIRKYMELSNIPEPDNISYPPQFDRFFNRNITKMQIKDVPWNVFVKPVKTKLFTGFFRLKPKIILDREFKTDFYRLPPDTEVWVSEKMDFLAEWRLYISDYRVIGISRYDDKEPEYDVPQLFANEIEICNTTNSVIKYGSIDIGKTNSGYSIVECNDAWALGLYKGSITDKDYVSMLWGRWGEIDART